MVCWFAFNRLIILKSPKIPCTCTNKVSFLVLYLPIFIETLVSIFINGVDFHQANLQLTTLKRREIFVSSFSCYIEQFHGDSIKTWTCIRVCSHNIILQSIIGLLIINVNPFLCVIIFFWSKNTTSDAKNKIFWRFSDFSTPFSQITKMSQYVFIYWY